MTLQNKIKTKQGGHNHVKHLIKQHWELFYDVEKRKVKKFKSIQNLKQVATYYVKL